MDFLFYRAQVEMFPESVEGIVEVSIASEKPGRIKCFGSYWPAKLYSTNCQIKLLLGERAKVVGRENITLLVMPINCQKILDYQNISNCCLPR